MRTPDDPSRPDTADRPGPGPSRPDETDAPEPRFAPERPWPHHSETAERQAALADNVRNYAIFLLDRDGIIRFWGEGAHLMMWWTKEEAEGAHLRLLYPEGGAQDGTAEDTCATLSARRGADKDAGPADAPPAGE